MLNLDFVIKIILTLNLNMNYFMNLIKAMYIYHAK